jgi:Leucine-rich repeat (LRR) protein
MGSNKLKRFPQSIEYLSKLVILDAEDNLITNIVNPTEL